MPLKLLPHDYIGWRTQVFAKLKSLNINPGRINGRYFVQWFVQGLTVQEGAKAAEVKWHNYYRSSKQRKERSNATNNA